MAVQRDDTPPASSNFLFLGNRLWLDFLNTKIKQDGEFVDLLGNYTDFVQWLTEARVLDDGEALEAMRKWLAPSEREGVIEQARAFRDVLKTAAESVTRREPVTVDVVSSINGVLRNHCRILELAYEGEKLVSRYVGTITEPSHLLAPIAESAAQSLTGDDQSLTRKCDNPTCVLYFHDTTKNHTRRWCSMDTCGNRLKAAAHYKRTNIRER